MPSTTGSWRLFSQASPEVTVVRLLATRRSLPSLGPGNRTRMAPACRCPHQRERPFSRRQPRRPPPQQRRLSQPRLSPQVPQQGRRCRPGRRRIPAGHLATQRRWLQARSIPRTKRQALPSCQRRVQHPPPERRWPRRKRIRPPRSSHRLRVRCPLALRLPLRHLLRGWPRTPPAPWLAVSRRWRGTPQANTALRRRPILRTETYRRVSHSEPARPQSLPHPPRLVRVYRPAASDPRREWCESGLTVRSSYQCWPRFLVEPFCCSPSSFWRFSAAEATTARKVRGKDARLTVARLYEDRSRALVGPAGRPNRLVSGQPCLDG